MNTENKVSIQRPKYGGIIGGIVVITAKNPYTPIFKKSGNILCFTQNLV